MPDKDLFVCEFRYSGRTKAFKKFKISVSQCYYLAFDYLIRKQIEIDSYKVVIIINVNNDRLSHTCEIISTVFILFLCRVGTSQ